MKQDRNTDCDKHETRQKHLVTSNPLEVHGPIQRLFLFTTLCFLGGHLNV